jgi:hypothetical protein
MAHAAHDDLEVDDLVVIEADDQDESPARPSPAPSSTHGSGSDVVTLVACAVSCVVIGLLLAAGPKLSWKMTQISEGFAYLGVHGGALMMGGLVLGGLALVRRAQNATSAALAERADDRRVLDQIALEQGQLRTVIVELQEAQDSVRDRINHVRNELEHSLQSLGHGLRAELPRLVPPPAAPTGDGNQHEAIFLLATTLDKVGEKIEQRLKTQYDALQEHLEDVGAAIVSARHSMEELLSQATANAAAAPYDDPGTPLGLLDTIDDEHVEPSEHSIVDQVSAALPSEPDVPMGGAHDSHWLERTAPEPEQVQALQQELDTQTKLMQLSSLLSDERLRQALQNMQQR